jgi:hypothetical protein
MAFMKRGLIQKRVLAIALLLPLSVSAQTFIYDQQSSDESRAGTGGVIIQNAQPTGQSFMPTLNQVGFVRLELFDSNNNNGLGATLYVNLRSGSLTGPIIGTSALVTLPDSFGLAASNQFVNFFFANPISVQPGTTYFFQPVVQSGDPWWVDGAIFYYSRGSGYTYGSDNYNWDYWFREGIVVPEPSLLALAAVGIGIATLSRRRFAPGLL